MEQPLSAEVMDPKQSTRVSLFQHFHMVSKSF